MIHRKTRRDRMKAKLKEVKGEIRRRMHRPIPEQGKWLKQVIRGFFCLPRITDKLSRSAEVPVPYQGRLAANANADAVRGIKRTGSGLRSLPIVSHVGPNHSSSRPTVVIEFPRA
jgi:hypothetical protein